MHCSRRRWTPLLLAAALVGACKQSPSPPSTEQDPIVALAAALQKPAEAGPVAVVTVEWAGADVAAVEQQLLAPLEQAASTIASPGLVGLAGIAWPGRAQLSVEFESGADPFAAMTALHDALPTNTLPREVSPPVIERIDRDALPLFAMFSDIAAAEARGPDGETAIEKLGYAVMREPGVSKLRWCGVRHDVLEVVVDIHKLRLGMHWLLDGIEAELGSRLSRIDLRQVMKTLEKAKLDPGVWLADVATLRIAPREGACIVVGPGAPPTLAIWGKPEGIANATRVLQATPGVRIFSADGAFAFVGTTLSPIDRRAAMERWLAGDRGGPAWVVQDGEDVAWLLAGPGTTLRSFSGAATQELHVWWPGAPTPLSAHVCGQELEVIRQAANAFTSASFDDLLDDITVWAPRNRAVRSFAIDREAAARLGVAASDIARLVPLLLEQHLSLRDDLIVRAPSSFPFRLDVRGTAGLVPMTEVGTVMLATEPAFITHIDRQRCIVVDLQPRRAEDRPRIEALIRERIELPAGVYVTIPPT